MNWIKIIAVYLCYWGIHRYRSYTRSYGTVKIIGRRCTRCKYEPRWDR